MLTRCASSGTDSHNLLDRCRDSLRDHEDCQTPRKSSKTSQFVGWKCEARKFGTQSIEAVAARRQARRRERRCYGGLLIRQILRDPIGIGNCVSQPQLHVPDAYW